MNFLMVSIFLIILKTPNYIKCVIVKDFGSDIRIENNLIIQNINLMNKINDLENRLQSVEQKIVPSGAIIAYNGLSTEIPNGLNNTPDLREKFLIGSKEGGIEKGEFGGTSVFSMSINVQDHTLVESEMPRHRHYFGDNSGDDRIIYSDTSASGSENWGLNSGSGEINTVATTGYTPPNPALGHDHPVSYDNNFTLLPPYYAVIYIMKL